MTYEEIEHLLRSNNHSSTVEHLRTAVGEEAEELGRGPGIAKNRDIRLDQARIYYAEDITRWIDSGDIPHPETLIGCRERYAKSWAFAQLINRLHTDVDKDENDDSEDDDDSFDDDAMARICEANAELGVKCVELIAALQNHQCGTRQIDTLALSRIREALDSFGAPTNNRSGNRKLELWERVELVLEELEGLRMTKAGA